MTLTLPQPVFDANASGGVDAADLAIWKTQYGGAPPTVVAIAAVPEPTAAVLVSVASVAIAASRRK